MSIRQTIGFLKSQKMHERRIAILPQELEKLRYPEEIYIEEGYGVDFQIADSIYAELGAHVVSREVVLQQSVICEPKIGESHIGNKLHAGQTVFGWIHVNQNQEDINYLLDRGVRTIAWENMYSNQKHIFWRNNELAGEAAIMHAFLLTGQMPYDAKVALIGRGNVAFGALRVLQSLGADVTVIRRGQENLLRETLSEYDVIVNAVLWDIDRDDHLISKENLSLMKSGSLIIDISADEGGGVESSHVTTMKEPIYEINQVKHYVVDHTPNILYQTASRSISQAIFPFLEDLILNNDNEVLNSAVIN